MCLEVEKPGFGVAFFSLEMPAVQAIQRMYSMWSGTPHTNVQTTTAMGQVPEGAWVLAREYYTHHIVDEPGLSLDDMSDFVARYKIEYDRAPAFVVIDYLELIAGAKGSGDGWTATEAVAARLKDWAKHEMMPVFVIHQANKQEKNWKPPTEDSAKGAGYTESDFVLGLWQPGGDPELSEADRLFLKDRVMINVLKNRAFGQTHGGVPYELTTHLAFKEISTDKKAFTYGKQYGNDRPAGGSRTGTVESAPVSTVGDEVVEEQSRLYDDAYADEGVHKVG